MMFRFRGMRTRGLPSRRRSERGAVILLAAISMVALLGVGALALDLGSARVAHRNAQGSADAAALAAAAALPESAEAKATGGSFAARNMSGSDVPAIAAACSARMGGSANTQCYRAGDTEIAVEVPFIAADPNPEGEYVRVRICQPQPTFFGGVIGQSNVTACAESVAERRQVGNPLGTGIIVLSPPERCPGLLIRGNADVSVTTEGAVYVDDGCPTALTGNGASFTLTAGLISIVGGYDATGCGSTAACFPGARPETGQQPIGDPFVDLDEPPPPTANSQCAPPTGNGPNWRQTCTSGRYLNNVDFGGGQGTVVLRPGIHYFDGDVDFRNKDVIVEGPLDPNTGAGVLLFVANGSINFQGNAAVALTPPDQGPYTGISIFQGRSNTRTSKITGDVGTMLGTVYAPNGSLEVGGNNTWDIDGMLIAGELELFGNMALNLTPPTDFSPVLNEEVIGLHR